MYIIISYIYNKIMYYSRLDINSLTSWLITKFTWTDVDVWFNVISWSTSGFRKTQCEYNHSLHYWPQWMLLHLSTLPLFSNHCKMKQLWNIRCLFILVWISLSFNTPAAFDCIIGSHEFEIRLNSDESPAFFPSFFFSLMTGWGRVERRPSSSKLTCA